MTKSLTEQKKQELRMMADIIVESAIATEMEARKRQAKRLEERATP